MSFERFYPIVETAAWVARLVGAGARLAQLRAKDIAREAIRREVRAALSACAGKAQLVVNDYWEIALEEGADYVHLGQSDLDGADLKAIRARGVSLGVSTHDRAELDRALSLDPDYVALGPVYPTILKQMPWAPQGLERLGEWRRLIGARPLVAIGGITLKRAPLCLAAGADCVAVVTDVLRAQDPQARVRDYLAATRAA
jgi:thiamine-phosphate pyrophosphorylase